MTNAPTEIMHTRQRRKVLHVLLDSDVPLTTEQVTERTGLVSATVRDILACLETNGWAYAPGQGDRRQGAVRYYMLTEHARPLVPSF